MEELRYTHRARLAVVVVVCVLSGAIMVAFVLDPEFSTALRAVSSLLLVALVGVVVLAVVSYRRRAVVIDRRGRRLGTRWAWRREPYWCDLDAIEIATQATQRASSTVGGPGIPFHYLVLWNTDARSPGPTWGARARIADHQRRALEDLAPWVPGLVPYMVELNGLSRDQVTRLMAVVPPDAWVRSRSP